MLAGVRFDSHFSGDEFFVRDHRVDGERILPAAVSLEMARFAGEVARERPIVALANVAPVRVCSVSGPKNSRALGVMAARTVAPALTRARTNSAAL